MRLRDLAIVAPEMTALPWELLLEADPSRSRVEGYVDPEFTRVALLDEVAIGVYCLQRLDATAFELMNIAVAERQRGKGIGRWLLGHAIGVAETKGARTIDVGTGNSSLDNLRFYQRAGFRIVGVVPDFFTDHYDELIVEDDIVCRDMVRLRLTLMPD